jgi:hypothetical protein
LNLNPESNSNFLDPKSFVWTQIIIGLEFKILLIKFLNQSSNSHFWRSSSFSLNFKKNHSNLFELGQISSQIFKIFISIRFVHFSPRLFSLPAQISPSSPTGHLSVGALQVYVSRFRKRIESKVAFAFFFPEQLPPPPPRDRTPACLHALWSPPLLRIKCRSTSTSSPSEPGITPSFPLTKPKV